MKKATLTVLGFLACAGFAAAQNKQSGVGKCDGKPEVQHMVDVGDRAGHSLVLVKQTCTWTTPMETAGLKSKDYTVTVVSDTSGKNTQDRGYVVINMDNGDKAFVRFTGKGVLGAKEGDPGTGGGTWSYAGGTGKLRGLTGKGTYKSANNEDQIEGEWAIAETKKK
jgi:hypothetical protein